MRQSQGGDYVVDPGVKSYVNEVGQRLAAVSDRKLPYEFKVLNNSVPNARPLSVPWSSWIWQTIRIST